MLPSNSLEWIYQSINVLSTDAMTNVEPGGGGFVDIRKICSLEEIRLKSDEWILMLLLFGFT